MTNDTETIIEPTDAVEAGTPAGDDLDAIRDLVLRAHPDVVPELIGGDTVEALLASVEPARVAWQRLADRIGAPVTVPPVPAGGEPPVAIDPDRLSTGEKIRRGLARGR